MVAPIESLADSPAEGPTGFPIIKGKTAIEIVNTLIRENFISTLQHAADMGIELHKAELSLKYGFKYIQDKDLEIKNN